MTEEMIADLDIPDKLREMIADAAKRLETDFESILDEISMVSRWWLLRELEDYNGLPPYTFKGIAESCSDANDLLDWLGLGGFFGNLGVHYFGDGLFVIDYENVI